MKRLKLTQLARPFICCVVTDVTLEDAARTIRRAERVGAQAFELNLPRLNYPSAKELEPIFRSTTWPIYTSCRRSAFLKVYGPSPHPPRDLSEMDRIEMQLEAVRAGASGMDMELDTFDPHPEPRRYRLGNGTITAAEITTLPAAVRKQREVMKRAHERDAEIVLSCHTGTVLKARQFALLAKAMAKRGPDLLKIVGVNRTARDLLETLEANLFLRSLVPMPFNVMSIGEPSRLGRVLFPFFGSSWVFCQLALTPGGFPLFPLVENMREILRRVDWRGWTNTS